YIWGRGYNSISVILDWTNTGEAPEVKACDIHSEQTTTSNADHRIGVLSLPLRYLGTNRV
ncbi:unnamed protein product, partial [Hymenolepis diminuta]